MNIKFTHLCITLFAVCTIVPLLSQEGSLLDQIPNTTEQSQANFTPEAPAPQDEQSSVAEQLSQQLNDEAAPFVQEPAKIPLVELDEVPIVPAEGNTPFLSMPEENETNDENAKSLTQEAPDDPSVERARAVSPKEHEYDQYAYLGEYLNPWQHDNSGELVEFLFDNAELSTLITYVEEKFNITFIADDNITPLTPGGKSILGTKISFRTHKPLSKKDAWNLFVAFLDMAGLAQVPGPNKNTYRLMSSQDPKAPQNATRSPLPTFIGVDPSLVPNNDTRIRYVYFVDNASLDTIKNVLDAMKSVSAPNLLIIPELNAIIMTDKAANIRSMLNVIKELDQANMPESLAVIKLKRMDATKAAQLYDALTKKEAPGLAARLLGTRKPATAEYFPEGARVIPEPRTNSLIVLGSRESIKKIADFMTTVVDKKDSLPEMPLYIYRLKFLDAEAMASILQQATQFQAGSEAAKAGGIRDGDKYLKPMTITAEKLTNSIIINADYDDYTKVYALLQKLDVEQPQVALKVFLISVDLTDNLAFGTQIRNKKPGVDGLIGNKTNFQTSGLVNSTPGSVVENTTANSAASGNLRLLGNLINLANGISAIGSTVVSLGSDAFGVWGVLNMLETHMRTTLIANPFLVTTHKFPAQFSIGQKRYVVTSTVFANPTSQNTFGYVDANLTIQITPQISKDGLITLDTNVIVDQFLNADPNSLNGNRTSKRLQTSVTVADNEVLALGGLIEETTSVAETGVPLLSSIPLLGWFFKNKTKTLERTSLLILIAPEIIKPVEIEVADRYTQSKVLDAKDLMAELRNSTDARDPIHRWLFKDGQIPVEQRMLEDYENSKASYVVSPPIMPKPTKVLDVLGKTDDKIPKPAHEYVDTRKGSFINSVPN